MTVLVITQMPWMQLQECDTRVWQIQVPEGQ